jgi:hypothetical protein
MHCMAHVNEELIFDMTVELLNDKQLQTLIRVECLCRCVQCNVNVFRDNDSPSQTVICHAAHY